MSPPLLVPLTELVQRETERERERDRERCPIPRALLQSSFNVPGIRAPDQVPQRGLYGDAPLQSLFLHIAQGHNEVPPPGPPHRAPSERDAPPLQSPFIHLSKSLVYEPPSRFLSGAPMKRDSRFQSLFYITFRILSEGAPLQVPLTERPYRGVLRFQSPPPTISQSSR